MNHDELLRELENLCKKRLELVRQKNKDYAKSGNCFHNFETCERVDLVSTEKAILVRMFDKMNRIVNLMNNEAGVKSESIYDTLADLSNYSDILSVYLKTKNRKEESDCAGI